MKDGIVVFDAPVNEGQSRWVIDAAKAKYPGKPIKYLVLTHHHNDHSGGMRTYVQRASRLSSPAKAEPFRAVVKAPHTISPDALEKQRRPANIARSRTSMTLKDDTSEIRLHNIPNPHAEGLLIGHVVGANIVWVTDLISPRGPIARNAATVAVGNALRKAQHHRRDHRRWPWHHRQAGGDPGRAGGELGEMRVPDARAARSGATTDPGPFRGAHSMRSL